jgi:heat shock protein HslJ
MTVLLGRAIRRARLATVAALGAVLATGCATRTTDVDEAAVATAPGRDRILDLACGGEHAELRFEGEHVTLAFDRKATRVVAEPVASGTRWASTVLDDTWVWNKGEAYTVSFRGQRLPPCTATERQPKPYVAIVHEPSVHLSIVGGTMTIRRPGAEPVEVAVGEPSMHEGDRVWRGSLDDRGLVLRVGGARCRDAMTGMPHPATALLTIGGDTHPGCAGDPVDLLAVGEWLIESIGGEPVPDEPPATIEFLPEGRVVGSGGCNRYAGEFRIGEGLAIGPNLASTRMACTESVMTSERRVLDALPTASAFDLDDSGRLVITIADGGTLVARRR